MSLKTGPQPYRFPDHAKVKILAEGIVSVFSISEDGVPESIVATSADGKLQFRTKTAFRGYINVADGAHFSLDVETEPSPFEEIDPTPHEVPEGMKTPETLEEKLKRFLRGMIAERYGRTSEEMETYDEATDLDVEDDITPTLSGYEVTEMREMPPPDPNNGEPEKEPAKEPDPGPEPPQENG